MSEEKKRPQGRVRGNATAKGQVEKREQVDTDKKKVGNADYSSRPKNAANDNNKAPEDRGLVEDLAQAALQNPQQVASGLSALAGLASQASQQQNNQQAKPSASAGNGGGNNNNGNFHSFTPGGGSGSPSSGQNNKKSGGLLKIIIFLVVAFLLVSCLMEGFGSSDSYTTTTSNNNLTTVTTTPTPSSTASSNSLATSIGGTFNKPETSYIDTSYSQLNTATAANIRDRYTTIKGNGEDTVTIMVYVCGTDLESRAGMGTSDIMEMVAADMSDQVNIILETGGTQTWKNNVIDSSTNQLWKVASGGLESLGNLGRKSMTEPATLVEFIQLCTTNYPADRYMLIFWDHGGGSVSGYGYDQYYPNSTMTLDEISYALENAGTKFDFVGFDACLMATVETAVALAPYADYMVASEETEPGTGWEYTNWLSLLAHNPSTPTTEVAKQIIDDFVSASESKRTSEKVSLSVVDLAEFEAAVPAALEAFAADITNAYDNSEIKSISDARSVAKEFGQSSRIDMVDLVDFAGRINTTSANALAEAVASCVKYNRVYNMKNSYGMSIFYPYQAKKYTSAAVQIYQNIGMPEAYTAMISKVAKVSASAQVAYGNSSYSLFDLLSGASSGTVSSSSSQSSTSYSTSDLLELLMGSTGTSSGSSSSSYSNSGYSSSGSSGLSLFDLLGGSMSYDNSEMESFASLFGRAHVDASVYKLADRDGTQVLVLDQDQWDMIESIGLNVWVDDGTGYLDLGVDDVYSFDEEGNLIVEYDGLWVSVNDQPVAYYVLTEEFYDDDTYRVTGYVPAMVNDELVKLIVEFTDENVDGTILGAQLLYDENVEAKGLMEIEEGDVIDFVCDYYDYDGNFQSTYLIGDTITVGSEGLTTGTIEIVDQTMLFGYRLMDLYGVYHWTPMTEYN